MISREFFTASSRLLLEDRIDAIDKIGEYTRAMSYEPFLSDSKTFDAVIRNSEIEERHSEVEWHRIEGMRNRLIHGYFSVNPSIVWRVLKENFGPLRTAIIQILNSSKEIP